MNKYWPTKKLGEVAEVIMGQSPPSSSYNERGDGLPFFQGKAEFGEIYPIPLKFCSSPSRIAVSNDILISVRAPVGNINIAKEKSCIGRGLGALRAKKNILNQMFLFYFMRKNENNWSRLSTGSTFSAIKGSSLRNFGVPVPSLTIQKQIVERMDKIAEARKLNDDLIQKSDELFQSLLHQELDPISKNWRVKKLPEVAKIQRGKFTPRPRNDPKYFTGNIPWIQTGDITNSDGTIYNYSQTLNEVGLKVSRIFPKGTIVITIAANIGDLAILGIDAAFPDSIVGIITDESIIDNKFLYFQMLLQKGYLNNQATQAAQKNINLQVLYKVNIYLPSKNEQKQIVAKLSAVQEYKKQLLEQKLKLKELFDSVLRRSISSRQVNCK